MGLSVCIKKDLGDFSIDVSWEVKNELAVLFGYSGSGKSVTFQMIAGLTEPDSGVIRLDSQTLFDGTSGINLLPQRRFLGYVFQDLALFPHMTVRQNILYGAPDVARAEKESRARELIKQFRISGLEDRLPEKISGGQKQRVAIARALIRRPHALLLDEPFSALDSPVRADMGKLLKEIQREFSIPVILITHDLSEACELAEKMIVYAEGRVVSTDKPEEICSLSVCRNRETFTTRPYDLAVPAAVRT
ncbi:MAG: ATP-binding cassette domain-containing protein [Nitrospirae bacterium]|nr:ATP-binding cassette domain-containing protein [Nitrospirota bacterium]